MKDDPLELIGVTLDERFRVDAYVEEGELSVTYRGHDLKSGQPVGVRCLNLPMTLDRALALPFIESFKERTRLYRRLAPGNSNFVQVLGAGTTTAPDTDRQVPFEIREWFDATTFSAYCAKRRSEGHEGWTLEDVLTALAPVVDGLAYAHDMGVTHAEINPNNLLVVGGTDRPMLKIVDFGEARGADEKSADGPVLRVLVPEYAAPELVDKQVGAIGPWTDVFSLGVIVLECLAGTLGTRNVAASVIVDPEHRPSVRKLGLRLPKPVEELLGRALASEPSRRPKNVATLWSELKSAAAAALEPVTAPGPVVPPSSVAAPKAVAPSKPAVLPKPPVRPMPLRTPSPSPAATSTSTATATATPTATPSATPAPAPPRAVHNPLVKETLFGLQPTPLAQLEAVAKPAPELAEAGFASDEAPTKRRETADTAAPAPMPDEDPLAGLGEAVGDDEPQVFLPALLQPTIGMKLRGWLAPVLAWLVARARDPAPRARATFAAGLFGGLVALTLCVRLCTGGGTPASSAAVTPSSEATTAAAPPPVPGPSAPTAAQTAAPQASAPVGRPEEGPSPTPSASPPSTVFTRALANAALEAAGGDLSECKSLGAIRGAGSIRATFNKSGGVARISIGPPYAETPEGACILDRFGRAQLAPFRGAPGSVNYQFNVAK